METIKHNRQPITEEMIEEFKNTYKLPTKEEEAEMTEEAKCLLEELKEKIKGKSFLTTEPIDTILKLETFEKEEDKK